MVSLEEANVVINNLPVEFDSHDFIESYLTFFERSYVNMLWENIESEEIFRVVNSQIGRYLAIKCKDLKIVKVDRKCSQNFRGNITDNQYWRKINE